MNVASPRCKYEQIRHVIGEPNSVTKKLNGTIRGSYYKFRATSTGVRLHTVAWHNCTPLVFASGTSVELQGYGLQLHIAKVASSVLEVDLDSVL